MVEARCVHTSPASLGMSSSPQNLDFSASGICLGTCQPLLLLVGMESQVALQGPCCRVASHLCRGFCYQESSLTASRVTRVA
jgi:hypothetical protein